MSDNTATSSYSRAAPHMSQRNAQNLTIDAELSPPGISVVPPVCQIFKLLILILTFHQVSIP